MREWKRCPKCGYTKIGTCPPCFPEQAKREYQQELAEVEAAEEDERRRLAGQMYCHQHERRDGCVRVRSIEEVRAELRSAGRRTEPEARRITWQDAFDQLQARYVP